MPSRRRKQELKCSSFGSGPKWFRAINCLCARHVSVVVNYEFKYDLDEFANVNRRLDIGLKGTRCNNIARLITRDIVVGLLGNAGLGVRGTCGGHK
jgi:hypothetical protein